MPAIGRASEDALKSVYYLQQDGSTVSNTALARALKVSPATVTKTLRRLAKIGLIVHEPYEAIRLSKTGEKVAREILRHHRLVELYLTEALGMGWDEVHEEAEVLEHSISPKLAERLSQVLRNPSRDPHGHPIPTKDGRIVEEKCHPLYSSSEGDFVKIVKVKDESPETLRYIGELGMKPGKRVRIVRKPPLEEPLKVQMEGITLTIGKRLAETVYVTKTGR